MTTYKTTTGLTKAIEQAIADLEAGKIGEPREYDTANARVKNLVRQCNALWSNPADVEDFAKLKNRLLEAWHNATN